MEGTQQAGHRRTPNLEERKQERALALALWLDIIYAVPYGIVAIAIDSLVMIAEILRAISLLTVVAFSLRVLRRTHRSLITDYDYGVGKLERTLSGRAAVLLLAAAGFVTWRAFMMKRKRRRRVFWERWLSRPSVSTWGLTPPR